VNVRPSDYLLFFGYNKVMKCSFARLMTFVMFSFAKFKGTVIKALCMK